MKQSENDMNDGVWCSPTAQLKLSRWTAQSLEFGDKPETPFPLKRSQSQIDDDTVEDPRSLCMAAQHMIAAIDDRVIDDPAEMWPHERQALKHNVTTPDMMSSDPRRNGSGASGWPADYHWVYGSRASDSDNIPPGDIDPCVDVFVAHDHEQFLE
jgi:hypothetical protein